MRAENPFSQRLGVAIPSAPIRARDDLPRHVRIGIYDILLDNGFSRVDLQSKLKQKLRRSPADLAQSIYGANEKEILCGLPWFYVFDVIEEFYAISATPVSIWERLHYDAINEQAGYERFRTVNGRYFDFERSEKLASAINDFFRLQGIAWSLSLGQFNLREGGPQDEALQSLLEEASREHPKAMNEFREALADISRRPEPDVSGCIQHTFTGLECLARELTGEDGKTLGKILASRPEIFPQPLGTVVEKIWGYASNNARHLNENGGADAREAEFLLGLSSVLANYLFRTLGKGD